MIPVSFFASARPQVFAHRGGCALGPENTIAAFDAGVAAGADGLELDVHLFPSLAGGGPTPVVCHATPQHAGCSAEKPLSVVLDEVAGWLAGHRDQVLLLYLEERSTREMAEVLGIGESNVTTRISRLKRRIRDHFESTGGTPCRT